MLRVATLENKECLKELLDEVKPTRELEKGADRDWMPGLKHAREKVAKVDTGDLLVIPGPSGRAAQDEVTGRVAAGLHDG